MLQETLISDFLNNTLNLVIIYINSNNQRKNRNKVIIERETR